MIICILILYTESWQPLADIVLPNVQKYANKHGYVLQVIKYPEPYPSDFGYNKISQTIKLFNEGIDAVLSLDLDTLITNHKIKIEDFVLTDEYFYISTDYNGINAGVFLTINGFWSKLLLEKVLQSKGQPKLYCEQDAIADYIRVHGSDFIYLVPQRNFNSYLYELYPEMPTQSRRQGQWGRGDFVLHLPAIGMQKRLDILNQIKADIIL